MPDKPIANIIPPVHELEARRGFLLRELDLVRQLLRVAKTAEHSRLLNSQFSSAEAREPAPVG